MDENIARGKDALAAGRWEEARAAFERALEGPSAVEALQGVSDAAWWQGDVEGCIGYLERGHAVLRQAGEVEGATITAVWLAVLYKKNLGNDAAYSGWLARGARLLEDTEPGPAHGWVRWAESFGATDPHEAVESASRAVDVSRRTADRDLELCALAELGNALVATGRVEEGLALVDEAMAATFAGEFGELSTVAAAACSMLVACDQVADLARIKEWCSVADTFMRTYGCPFLYADCRQRYGSVLMATGHWDDAERELQAATRSAGPETAYHVLALGRLALLRSRQGRLEEAEGILEPITEQPAARYPLGALHHARGQDAVAAATLARLVEASGPGDPDLAPALDLLVDVHLALGDHGAARAAAEQLASAPETHRTRAHAAYAAGRLALSEHTDGAQEHLERAMDLFARSNLPYETACVRLALARTFVDVQPQVATSEAQAAFATLDRLGATPAADAAASLLRSLGAPARTGPKGTGTLTKREQEVLHLVAAGLSNPEIAERLFISRKTAAHHVSNVLAKLGVRNRAEATAHAMRTAADN